MTDEYLCNFVRSLINNLENNADSPVNKKNITNILILNGKSEEDVEVAIDSLEERGEIAEVKPNHFRTQ